VHWGDNPQLLPLLGEIAVPARGEAGDREDARSA
jgi:hypothetical protein